MTTTESFEIKLNLLNIELKKIREVVDNSVFIFYIKNFVDNLNPEERNLFESVLDYQDKDIKAFVFEIANLSNEEIKNQYAEKSKCSNNSN